MWGLLTITDRVSKHNTHVQQRQEIKQPALIHAWDARHTQRGGVHASTLQATPLSTTHSSKHTATCTPGRESRGQPAYANRAATPATPSTPHPDLLSASCHIVTQNSHSPGQTDSPEHPQHSPLQHSTRHHSATPSPATRHTLSTLTHSHTTQHKRDAIKDPIQKGAAGQEDVRLCDT